MTKDECKKIFAVLKGAYQERVDFSSPLTKRVWFEAIRHNEIDVAEQATMRLIQTMPFPPSPADINKQVSIVANPDNDLDAIAAWGIVIDAVRKFGQRRGEEALSKMPIRVRQVVRFFGWREICLSGDDAIRREFLRMYETYKATSQERDGLPGGNERLLALTANIGNNGNTYDVAINPPLNIAIPERIEFEVGG